MYIHVKVTACARLERLVETKPSYFAISVREKAKANAANKRIVELIGEFFKTKNVRIVNGHHSCTKLISID